MAMYDIAAVLVAAALLFHFMRVEETAMIVIAAVAIIYMLYM